MSTERYCKPWNAGLASETPAVCRRIGRLLTALDLANQRIAELCRMVNTLAGFRKTREEDYQVLR